MTRDNSYLIGNQFAKGSGPNKTSFKKGMNPWNAGRKGIRVSPKSEFKKGCRPAKTLSVGSITIRTDKTRKKRRWIKIAEPKTWILYAIFVWVQNNGEIPKGLLVHHLDKDTLNDDISNLSLVTRSSHINIHRKEVCVNPAMAEKRIKDECGLLIGHG
jgi:hypothetical protein